MKLTNFTTLAALLAASVSAHAGEITGHTTLTLWFDQGGVASIDLRQEDGRILGNSNVSQNGIVNLERSGETFKGYADDGFVDLTCLDGTCKGIIGSNTVEATFTTKDGEMTMRGALNHVAISAHLTGKKLEITGDGSLELRRQDDGSWEGMGFLTRDLGSRFTARLESSGTLRAASAEDPGFFLIQLVAPLVRNGTY